MICLKQMDVTLLQETTHQLIQQLLLFRTKPYLPIWGELFCTLREIRKIASGSMQKTLLFPLNPTGQLVYDSRKDRFVAEIDELNIRISMETEELIDSFIHGRFPPLLSESLLIEYALPRTTS